MKDFRQLKVSQKSHQLALALYQITASFPRAETYVDWRHRFVGPRCRSHRIWPKDAGETEMPSWPGFAVSPEAQPASWNIIYSWREI